MLGVGEAVFHTQRDAFVRWNKSREIRETLRRSPERKVTARKITARSDNGVVIYRMGWG